MRKLCVIGDPVGHSKSPVIHNAMLRAAGLEGEYTARRVARSDTAGWLEQAKEEGYDGFNATMPHKQSLVPLMDWLSEDARRFGAVNTVCIRNGRAYGYNTDGDGFLQALEEAGMTAEGRRVLVLGAGGAAKAVVAKLAQAGAADIAVANRTLSRAAQVCRVDGQEVAHPADFAPDTLRRLARGCGLVVNCTSLGMTGTQGDFDDLSFLEALAPGAGVFDLIYSPPCTELLKRAGELGLRTANGLGMLIWQAVFALEQFTQTTLDGGAMVAAARTALEESL